MTTKARYRYPATHRDSTTLLVLVAAAAGAIAVVAVVAAVTLWFRLNSQVDRIDRLGVLNTTAAQSNFASRRAASYESCLQREQLKRDLRLLLARFQVNPRRLPESVDGRPVLSPLPEGCTAYVNRTVPQSARP